jgi:hypothetical protein
MTGRPTKYKPEYCDAVVEHCKNGSSLTSFAASIDVCRDTISEWVSAYPAFSVSVKKAKAHCAAWWEQQAREGATGTGKQNPTLCIFGLKNMSPDDWRDKVETQHSGTVEYTKIVKEYVRPKD